MHVITGDVARQILATSVTDERWIEVYLLDPCGSGCKVYGRRIDGQAEYAVVHMAAYGCGLGRNDATTIERVAVERNETATV